MLRKHRLNTYNAALILLLAAGVASPAAAVWHHATSPYRGRFIIESQPNHPDAGVTVSVPVCGLAPKGGEDFFAFNEHGRRLQLLSLGQSTKNEAIAVVENSPGSKEILIYFGSEIRSPQNRTGFIRPLTCSVHPLPTHKINGWSQVSHLLQNSTPFATIFADRIALRHNPVNAHDAFLVDFQGTLKIDRDDEYTYMLVPDDVGFLLINGELVIDRSGGNLGAARRGEYRGTVTLKEGTHEIRCVVAELGGEQSAIVGQWIDEKNKFILEPQHFIQPGSARLDQLETRHETTACPIFWYRYTSYIGYNDRQYTEVELGTYNDKASQWRFTDGGTADGATVRRIFFELDTKHVQARQGRTVASGEVNFPETAPPVRQMTNQNHFQHYASIMLAEDLPQLDLSTLEGYRDFLSFKEFNPQTIPVCKAILAHPDIPPEYRQDVLVQLARIAAGHEPDTARTAYTAALKSLDAENPARRELMMDYAAVALLELQDIETANSLLRAVERGKLQGNTRLQHLKMDVALNQEKPEQAQRLLDELRGATNVGRNQRFAAVKANALRERFYNLLDAGFLRDAHNTLWEWISLAPQDRFSGNWPLARARLWRAVHRQKGALEILDAAMRLNPMLPNLPEIQFEKAQVLTELGKHEQAVSIAQYIIEEYPNHPVAQKAKALVQ